MANGFDPRSQFYKTQASQVAQKRQALTYARQRQDAEERTKIQNVNTLSGFNAASVPEGAMREIYEDRIRDAQAYMNGVGSYEGQEYSALEAANKISGLTTMFNKMSAHNMGAVAEARDAYKSSAFEPAEDRERINPYGDPSGEAVYASNSPDGYRARVQKHNNYFQWTGEYDANGDPLGYMIGDDGQPTGEPTSIFEMQGYANPSAFESDTVREPIPPLVDVVNDPRLLQRINTLATRPSTIEATKGMDAIQAHQYVIGRVLKDYMGGDKAHMEFRESIVRQLQINGKALNEEEVAAFVNDPTSDPELLENIQKQAAEILTDLTYISPTVTSPYSGTLFVASQGGTDVGAAPYNVELSSLAEPITVAAGEQLPGTATSYNINGAGVDPRTGDVYMQINYEEAEELPEHLRGVDGIEPGVTRRNQTIRIPFTEMDFGEDRNGNPILINAPSTLALEAFRNLPASEQQRIARLTSEINVTPDQEILDDLNNQGGTPPQDTQPPASTTAATTQGAQAQASTTASQPQQEGALDIQEIPLENEVFEDDQSAGGAVPQSLNNAPGTTATTSPDGGQLVSVSSLPQDQIDLAARATEANQRHPIRGASRTPEIAAAIETLRDPSATDDARARAESVLQAEVDRGEAADERSRTEEIPNNATVYRNDVYVPATENTQNPVSVPGREGNWEYVGDRIPTSDPEQQVYRPMTSAQRERGETGMAGALPSTFTEDVGRVESALTEAIGDAARGLGLGELDDAADEIGRNVTNSLFGPSEFKRQTGEAVSDIVDDASDFAADVRDNAGPNLRRAYDAAREAIGSAGSAFLDFMRGGPSQEEIDRQRFEAARQRQAAEDEGAAASGADPDTVVDLPETGQRGADTPITARPEPGSPRQAQAEAELRESLETVESEQMSGYVNELEGLVPEMNLISEFEGYARRGPGARRANIPTGDGGKPHPNSGYTIGGLDISVHAIDDLPFLKRVIKDDDFEKIKQLEGLKGQAAQDKLNELSEGGFDASLSYLTPDDIRLIEAETYRSKVLPDLKTSLEENGASVEDFKNLPLSVRDAMNSVFFLSPPKKSPRTTKLLAKAMNSGEKSDWEKLVKELDRFWDRTGKTQEERVKDKDDGISRGHVRRMQTSAAQVAKQYDIPYTKS